MKRQEPRRGDVLCIEWSDITEDSTGNTELAKLTTRVSYGLFWEEKIDPDAGLEVLVTTTTLDPGGPDQQGYCIYPAACIRKITVVKRAPRSKK